jgi:hypothetical protein
VKQQIKTSIARIGRPVWKRLRSPIYTRIDWRIAMRLEEADMRLEEAESSWKQHVPAFLNAVSSVQTFGRELARSKQDLHEEIVQVRDTLQGQNTLVREALQSQGLLLQDKNEDFSRLHSELDKLRDELKSSIAEAHKVSDRVEFVRREIMYEMRYGREALESEDHKVRTQIVNPEKLSVAINDEVKLNLGCGHLPMAGYINVDMRELPGVDVVADVGDLPFERASLREVFSSHLLEHFPQEKLVRRLLPYWFDLLVPGGEFRAIVPDGQAMLAALAAGNYAFEEFREVLFGAQDYAGDFHYNLLTPSSLTNLLEGAGFRNIQVKASGRRNGKCFEFEVTAIK